MPPRSEDSKVEASSASQPVLPSPFLQSRQEWPPSTQGAQSPVAKHGGLGHVDMLWPITMTVLIHWRKPFADDVQKNHRVELWTVHHLKNPNDRPHLSHLLLSNAAHIVLSVLWWWEWAAASVVGALYQRWIGSLEQGQRWRLGQGGAARSRHSTSQVPQPTCFWK